MDKTKNIYYNDKFSVINIHNCIFDNKHFENEIGHFLESYLLNDIYIFSVDLIHQFLWNELNIQNKTKDEIYCKIDKKLNLYLISFMKNIKRDVIRSYKKKKFILSDLISLLNKLIIKISRLSKTFNLIDNEDLLYKSNSNFMKYCWGKSKIIEVSIKKLCTKFLSDPIIMGIIKSFIIDIDFNKKMLSEFYCIIKKYNYYHEECEKWFIILVEQVITDNLNLDDNLVVFKNDNFEVMSNIYKLTSLYSYYMENFNKFDFIKNNIIFDGIKMKMTELLSMILDNFLDDKFNINFIIDFLYDYKLIIALLLDFNNDSMNILFKLVILMDLFDISNITNLNNIVMFYKNINIIMTNLNNNVNTTQSLFLFDEKFIKIVKKNIVDNKSEMKLIDNINKIVNNLLIYNINNDVKVCHSTLNILYLLISKIKSNDMFILYYEKYLIIRLTKSIDNVLQSFNEQLQREINEYSNLQKHFKICDLRKISKIINDFHMSIILNSEYINTYLTSSNQNYLNYSSESLLDNFNCITSSYNNWSINISEGFIIMEQFMETEYNNYLLNNYNLSNIFVLINSYNSFYSVEYSDKRMLVWYPHLGLINSIFESNNCCSIIKMLPIHKMMIDFIDYKSDYDSIIEFFLSISTYSKDYIENLLKSLIKSNLYKLVKNKLVGNILFKGDINLIDIFNSISNIDIVRDDRIIKELTYSRKMILCAIVNSVLKIDTGVKYDLDILMDSCSKKQDLFTVNELLLKDCLTYMEEKDYINYNKESGIITKQIFF
jgi:hypothetical protein